MCYVPRNVEQRDPWNIPKDPITGPPLGPELQRRLVIALSDRLPKAWFVGPAPVSRDPRGPDGLIEIRAPRPGGQRVHIPIESKARIEPTDVPSVVARAQMLRAGQGPVIIGAPFLSSRTRQLLADAGVGYADITGNVRVLSDKPALFIELSGADVDPWPDTRPLRSLKGSAAGRVMRGLTDFRPPIGVRELAARSKTPVGTVSRVVNLLEREALLTRGLRGRIEDVNWANLLRRWTQDYGFQRSNRVTSFLEPRGLPVLQTKLTTTRLPYAATGSLAARDLAPIVPPRLAMVFTNDVEDLAKALDLRQTSSGSNVLLAEPFDMVVFERTRRNEGVVLVAPSQAAADLLTGPGRSPAEAEALLSWMTKNEDAWRT
jgi:hypothetical protein